jgi:hypothetical protein
MLHWWKPLNGIFGHRRVVAIPQVGDYTTDISDAPLNWNKPVAPMFAFLSEMPRFLARAFKEQIRSRRQPPRKTAVLFDHQRP